MPLNSSQVKTKKAGAHADGGGLYLVVRDTGERIWAFRFTASDGRRAMMEFARAGDREGELGLSDARDQARGYRLGLKKDGIDPRYKKQIEAKGGKVFKEYWNEKAPGWCVGKNKDEAKAWSRSLRDIPTLHDLKLHEIDASHIVTALNPIWYQKPVTANRTRERIEKLLDSAKVEKFRSGENPAAWRGNLKLVFPSPRKLNRKKGHASVPYAKAPTVMAALRYDPGVVARCVEVGILTVTRSKEIRLMEFDEIDFDKKLWLIPGDKMKIKSDSASGKPHLVPLSDQAIEMIQSMPKVGKYVFPSNHTTEHQPFFANALTNCIRRAGFDGTMHGMRTTFRNWGADSREHNFRREVLEFCLSHRVGDEAELSYWTSEMIDRRRDVLDAWADYILPRKARARPRPDLKVVS